MKSMMIDLETLSTEPNAAILTIGALWFDPYSYDEPGPGFHVRVEIDNQNRDISDEVIAWWGQQAPEVQQEAFNEQDRIPLADALKDLAKFSQGATDFWSHGTVFDICILEHAYIQQGMRSWIPWKYHAVRDCRTVLKISNTEIDRTQGGAHNSLVDCWVQATCLQKSFDKMGLFNDVAK